MVGNRDVTIDNLLFIYFVDAPCGGSGGGTRNIERVLSALFENNHVTE
jgi:hypothetical protein